MNDIPLLVVIFFIVSVTLTLYGVLRPESAINSSIRWFQFSLKLYGFEGEIKPTPKAKIICRLWNVVMLLLFSFFIFSILSGQLK